MHTESWITVEQIFNENIFKNYLIMVYIWINK